MLSSSRSSAGGHRLVAELGLLAPRARALRLSAARCTPATTAPELSIVRSARASREVDLAPRSCTTTAARGRARASSSSRSLASCCCRSSSCAFAPALLGRERRLGLLDRHALLVRARTLRLVDGLRRHLVGVVDDALSSTHLYSRGVRGARARRAHRRSAASSIAADHGRRRRIALRRAIRRRLPHDCRSASCLRRSDSAASWHGDAVLLRDTRRSPPHAARAPAAPAMNASGRRAWRSRRPECRTSSRTSCTADVSPWPRSMRSNAISTPAGVAPVRADQLDRLAH